MREAQYDALVKMRAVREALLSSSSSSSSGLGVGGDSVVAGGKELSRLREENDRLKKENVKQAYRIDHLCGSVLELQGR